MQSIHKRKLRLLLFFIARLCILFFITLLLLFGGYLFLQQRRHPLISPLIQTSRTITISTQDTIVAALLKKNIETTSTQTATDSSVRVTLKSGATVVFSEKKDITTQITSLQRIISQLTIEGKQATTIDLRFNNPLVIF